jgi:acetylglutamate kinase
MLGFHCLDATRSSALQEAIQKADTLIEALGWIRRFRDKITVIKLGGSVMETPDALLHVLVDVVFMETVGMRPVLVHGGGAAISRAMDAAGIPPRFVQGRRYTDDRSLEIVEQVLAHDVNQKLARHIEELGGRAMNLNFSTTNVLYGERIQLTDEQGVPVDLGHVGRVTRVDRGVIENLCYSGQVPVIPSMCLSEDGQKLNVNADTAAMAVAQALGAEKLVFLSDVSGVLADPSDAASLIHSLGVEDARSLIGAGVISGGMIPKVEACLETLEKGVGKIHIVDGRIRHSLLLEIYTTSGVGTEIVRSVKPQLDVRG